MAQVKPDKFANVAYADVSSSAIDTLTFEPIRFAVGIFQGVGLILHRILYYPSMGALRELVAATDALQMALTTSNRLTSIVDVSESAIIDRRSLAGIGVAVDSIELPFISDFTGLPGGGKILPSNPFFAAVKTAGAAAPSRVYFQLDFTFVELADKDYIELIQSMLPSNI